MAELGSRLIELGVINAQQLEAALSRQRTHGGRLGVNLKAMGFIREEDLAKVFQRTPLPPKNIKETGLEYAMIEGLVLKQVLTLGEFKIADVSARVKLPPSMVEYVLENLRKEHLVEVKGASGYTSMAYEYRITEAGRDSASRLLELCRYVGPAPIPLEMYTEMIELQTVKGIVITEEEVKKAFSHLVISDRKVQQLGPAITSGQAMFIYGPPGNGKSSIAEAISSVLTDPIYIPYAVSVGEQIINIYDPISHILVEEDPGDIKDQRWLKVRRPVVMTGGELTMRMLDLDYNPVSKYYEASLQMKANNGLLIIDDFGRQQAEPRQILNRWIVPLDRRIDFMTLHTGMKFTIPFDMLMIFATNIEPKTLVDDAFLRRIRYKIKIDHPSADEFCGIFKAVCHANSVAFNQSAFNYLIDQFYNKRSISFSASHPRDIVDHVINYSRYYNRPPAMTEETVQYACENYFVTG